MSARIMRGEHISPGVATGTFCTLETEHIPRFSGSPNGTRNADREIDRLEQGIEAAVRDLTEAEDLLRRSSYHQEAEIVRTHLLMLKDPSVREKIHDRIREKGTAAELALEHVLKEMTEVFDRSHDIAFSEKSADIKDILFRLKRKLSRTDAALFKEALAQVPSPVVAVSELLPSLVLEAVESGVKGFIVREGTRLSHAAILARSFGIPVLKISVLSGLKEGEEVRIDASSGVLYIGPGDVSVTPETTESLSPAGKRIPVRLWINITDPRQARGVLAEDAEGIGLYRTEFLFMQKQEGFPTEEEQYEVYTSLFAGRHGKPVTVRTLDIGGDKELPYFSLGPQPNPALGLRAHRIYQYHPEILRDQAKALLRAAAGAKQLRILYPMIETVDDLVFVKGLLQEARRSLVNEGIPHQRDFQEGVLIEVPSAAWHIRELLDLVEFASVGTNDLLQYFFAVDRSNANVYRSYRPESPASLRLLKSLVDIARDKEKPLEICGEIASDTWYLPLLIGLGFEHLSIDPHAVRSTRAYLSEVNLASCRELADRCIEAKSTAEASGFLDEFLSTVPGAESRKWPDYETIDPVCGMVVHTEGNQLQVEDEGRTYYFCSPGCRDTFLRQKLRKGGNGHSQSRQ